MKPRLLYLCGQAPWPRNGGALLRNYWMIAALSHIYAVDLVTADETPDMPGDFAAMVQDYASFPRSAAARTGLGRLARAALPNESSLTAGWTSGAMRDYVAERVGRYPYAAIQFDLPMHAALPRRDAIPIVYNAHNCESALLARRAATEAPHLAAALSFDAFRVRNLERAIVGRATMVAACAEDDVRDFERFAPGVRAKAAIVPNGVDVESYAHVRAMPSDPQTIVITGSMDWRPNQSGLRWFLRDVLPILRKALPAVRVRIAGRMGADLAAELATYPNVEPQPNPIQMGEHIGAASVVAAPIVASSGTRLRILEAWAAGRPVITTSPGAFGLDYEDGRNLMVRDDPAEFAHGIVKLLSDPALREHLADGAARSVQRYDWESIGTGLLVSYLAHIGVTPYVLPAITEEFSVAEL